jgi:hypothetical protein
MFEVSINNIVEFQAPQTPFDSLRVLSPLKNPARRLGKNSHMG